LKEVILAKLSHAHCSICNHAQRFRIERLRAAGSSYASLAKKFGIGADAVFRHWKSHVSPGTKSQLLAGMSLTELAERAAEEDLALIDYLAIVRGALMRMFMASAEAGDKHAMTLASGRILQCLAQIGQITGEMRTIGAGATITTNNTVILNSPLFAQLQAAILNALEPFPQARLAVVAALRSIEDAPPAPSQAPLMLGTSPAEEAA